MDRELMDGSHPTARLGYLRAGAGALVGCVAVGLSTAAGTWWSVAALAGWDAAASTLLIVIWADIATMTPERTARAADREAAPQAAAELAVICAAVSSLVAIAFTLVDAHHAEHVHRAALIGLAVMSVLLSWGAVHTVYMLRYARQYTDESAAASASEHRPTTGISPISRSRSG